MEGKGKVGNDWLIWSDWSGTARIMHCELQKVTKVRMIEFKQGLRCWVLPRKFVVSLSMEKRQRSRTRKRYAGKEKERGVEITNKYVVAGWSAGQEQINNQSTRFNRIEWLIKSGGMGEWAWLRCFRFETHQIIRLISRSIGSKHRAVLVHRVQIVRTLTRTLAPVQTHALAPHFFDLQKMGKFSKNPQNSEGYSQVSPSLGNPREFPSPAKWFCEWVWFWSVQGASDHQAHWSAGHAPPPPILWITKAKSW